MKLKVNVTQSHIDRGNRSGHSCPIALALRAQYPQICAIYVGKQTVTWYEKENYRDRNFPLPQTARDFVHSFDGCETVSPFSFELDVEGLDA